MTTVPTTTVPTTTVPTTDGTTLVRRAGGVLLADPSRVIIKLFLPGQEILAHGISRADAVIQRVLAMSETQVTSTLNSTLDSFNNRHLGLRATFTEHARLLEHRLPASADISIDRRDLIGAYCTQEYSIEAAALLNPSMVAHPDQSGLAPGELRFIMSVRAVGEGHISSVEFRTGVVTDTDDIRIDEPGRHLVTGEATPATMSREFLKAALAERTDASLANHLLSLLPVRFSAADLDIALASVRKDRLTRGSTNAIIDQIRWIASCNYELRFPAIRELSERVMYPTSPDESNGIEDVRFTRFTEDDGSVTYYATYTAYDGAHVAPHLIQTNDFETFQISQLVGTAAKNKGVAIFPRRVGGKYVALSRWDRESIDVATSTDTRRWNGAVTVQAPEQPWELIQLGNCGPPIETSEGWLVLTHGVGPMRTYGIGVILLDLEDPSKLIGALTEPILTPNEEERDGYVPNVVYSCGALLHQQTLVVPYGCSDSSIRFAFVDVPELLNRLRATGP